MLGKRTKHCLVGDSEMCQCNQSQIGIFTLGVLSVMLIVLMAMQAYVCYAAFDARSRRQIICPPASATTGQQPLAHPHLKR